MCAEVWVMLSININFSLRPQFQRDFILLLPKEVGHSHYMYSLMLSFYPMCYIHGTHAHTTVFPVSSWLSMFFHFLMQRIF